MSYPIAMIPYANMAPFQEMGPPPGCHFVDCTPTQSIRALKAGQVWAAALPVGGLAALEGVVEQAGPFGIAVDTEVQSVLFFSDTAFADFTPPRTLRITSETASSVRLLYLLFGYAHGFNAMPAQVATHRVPNGELVIGDTALVWAREFQEKGQVHGYLHCTDLAAEWYARHRLPFVFACWVIHLQAPHPLRRLLADWFLEFSKREPELITQVAPKVVRKLNLPTDYVINYLKIIRRCFIEQDMAGQTRFLDELRRHAVDPLFPRAS